MDHWLWSLDFLKTLSYKPTVVKLSVNINKVATLRNARGKDRPNVLTEAQKIIRFGGQGITVHPRPDGRHILWSDVEDLKQNIDVELNIEGYPSSGFLKKVLETEPDQCTLVPDPPEVLTSNAGWDVSASGKLLAQSVAQLKSKPIRVSVFVDPKNIEIKELIVLRDMGVDRIELYTEFYGDTYLKDRERAIEDYKKWSQRAESVELGVNAGHDLNLENLAYFCRQIPTLKEVSIGHALICDALNWGWAETLKKYLACLKADGSP